MEQMLFNISISTGLLIPEKRSPVHVLLKDNCEDTQNLCRARLCYIILCYSLSFLNSQCKVFRMGAIDFNLYNETFADWAKTIPRCKLCLSELHGSDDCEHAHSLDQLNVQSKSNWLPFKFSKLSIAICIKFNSEN